MNPSDAALIRSFLDGEPAAVSRITAWAHEVLDNPRLALGPDAADLAQDVLRRLLVALGGGRFRGASSLRTYVWRVAEHAAIDCLRARRARPAHAPLDETNEPTDPEPLPDQSLDRDQRRKVFAEILAGLDEDCRRLFHLIAFDELSYAAIAERLGTTEGAVKVRALRCREKAATRYRSVTSAMPARLFPVEGRE